MTKNNVDEMRASRKRYYARISTRNRINRLEVV